MNFLKYMKISTNILVTLTFILIFSSCDKTRNTRAKEYIPEMRQSRAYEIYSENPNFVDNKTALKPVDGTVPRDMIPYQYPNNAEGKISAGKELTNTIELNKATIEQGRKMYNRFCTNCHGISGDGNGFLYTSGKYPIQPTSLIDDNLKSIAVGEIYHVITLGSAIMGAHGSQIAPDDRWKIIHYIKEELQK